MADLARLLIVFGAVTVLVGAALLMAPRIPFLGRLPGDLFLQREGTTIFVPIVTSLVLSVVVTLILNLLVGR